MRRLFYSLSLLLLLMRCVYHDLDRPVVDCAVSGPSLTLTAVTAASGCGVADGRIQVEVSGGEMPYTWLLNNAVQPAGDFQHLAAGIYSVGVVDANSCDTLISNIIVRAEGFSFTADVVKDSLCEANSGVIALQVGEGVPPYRYQLNDGAFTDSNIFTGVAHGSHQVTIRDGQDCIVSLHVTVPHGVTGVSWVNDIRPIMVTYCATSGCHNGSSRADLRDYARATQYAADIKAMTQDGSMPFDGPRLAQTLISQIACWVDDGAPNN